MTTLRDVPLVFVVLTATGCELVPFCDAVPDANQCAAGGESTGDEGDGDGDGDGDGEGDGEPGDGDGEPGDGDGDGDGDGEPPDPIAYPDNPPEDYTRVDRMGMPAIATAVISSRNKDAYNAANPTDDADGIFFLDFTPTLMSLHAALDDDLQNAGLVACGAADCLFMQAIDLMIPDTLEIDLEVPASFPNGRTLTDPVIDITLAVLLLDLSVMGQTATTFAELPLNPPMNDVPFTIDFPYLSPPN